jgi:hypothetical protein
VEYLLFIYHEETLGGMLLPQPRIDPANAWSWTQLFPPLDDLMPLGRKDEILREFGGFVKCGL